jgi:hypothetical protein
MTNLKKLKKLILQLPADFEQSVWKTIYVRVPQRISQAADTVMSWGEMLWRQPAWLSGLVCAVLLTGMALGQFHASFFNNDASPNMSELYVNSLNQGENI